MVMEFTKKGILTLILAGASVDDVFAIIMFSIFLGIYSHSDGNIGMQLLNIPISILLDVIIGIIAGFILLKPFKKFHMRDTREVLLVLAFA